MLVVVIGTLRSKDADDNENVKKKKRFNKQNNNFARASHFFAHLMVMGMVMTGMMVVGRALARVSRKGSAIHPRNFGFYKIVRTYVRPFMLSDVKYLTSIKVKGISKLRLT